MTNKLRSILAAAIDTDLLAEALASEIADNIDYTDIAATIYEEIKYVVVDDLAEIGQELLGI